MFYAIAVVLVLIADQALKYWVSLNIELNVGEQALIPGVINNPLMFVVSLLVGSAVCAVIIVALMSMKRRKEAAA